MNIQNHANLAKAKWDMARFLRLKYHGKTIPDDVKATIHHLEEMSIEHSRRASIGQVTFIREA